MKIESRSWFTQTAMKMAALGQLEEVQRLARTTHMTRKNRQYARWLVNNYPMRSECHYCGTASKMTARGLCPNCGGPRDGGCR